MSGATRKGGDTATRKPCNPGRFRRPHLLVIAGLPRSPTGFHPATFWGHRGRCCRPSTHFTIRTIPKNMAKHAAAVSMLGTALKKSPASSSNNVTRTHTPPIRRNQPGRRRRQSRTNANAAPPKSTNSTAMTIASALIPVPRTLRRRPTTSQTDDPTRTRRRWRRRC